MKFQRVLGEAVSGPRSKAALPQVGVKPALHSGLSPTQGQSEACEVR